MIWSNHSSRLIKEQQPDKEYQQYHTRCTPYISRSFNFQPSGNSLNILSLIMTRLNFESLFTVACEVSP